MKFSRRFLGENEDEQENTTTFFFIFLISLPSCIAQESTVDETGWGFGPIKDHIRIEIPFTLSANSNIPTVVGTIAGYGYSFGLVPQAAKWVLIHRGEIKYVVQAEGAFASYPEAPDWWPYPYPNVHFFVIEGTSEFYVPWFPEMGDWSLQLVLYETEFGVYDKEQIFAEWTFTVGESSWIDNLMAPIYIHTKGGLFGLGILPIGSINIALPGIFWWFFPVLIGAGVILSVRYWKVGIGAGIEKLKRGRKNVEK